MKLDKNKKAADREAESALAKRRAAVVAFLEDRVWKDLPPEEIGRVLSRAEEDALLGYGPDGYAKLP